MDGQALRCKTSSLPQFNLIKRPIGILFFKSRIIYLDSLILDSSISVLFLLFSSLIYFLLTLEFPLVGLRVSDMETYPKFIYCSSSTKENL